MAIKHAFTSPKEDGTDPTLVKPSDWNADHVTTRVDTLPVADGSGKVVILNTDNHPYMDI